MHWLIAFESPHPDRKMVMVETEAADESAAKLAAWEDDRLPKIFEGFQLEDFEVVDHDLVRGHEPHSLVLAPLSESPLNYLPVLAE